MSDNEDIIIEEDEALKQFLPSGFGKQSQESGVAAQIERSKRDKGVSIKREKGSDDDDDDDESDEDDNPEDDYPISHELVLKTHDRPITTLDVDYSGSRLISGSTDCTFKLHDFASMTPSTLRAFKSVDPHASKTSATSDVHPIHHVEFNPLAPSQVLVITATRQGRIYDRDGELTTEFVKGDPYLRDMNNTKGHVSEITSGAWNPIDRDLCVTAGTDSTVRIWDTNVKRGQKAVIVYKSKAAGSAGRTRMTAVRWSSPAQGGPNILVSAALDGSLVMWSGNGPYNRPAGEIRGAHKEGTWTGGIDISKDGFSIVTRGGDDTIKLWDSRKFKAPITTVEHKSTSERFQSTNIRFSPTSTSIITGSDTGHLHILNPFTLKPEVVTPVTPGSALITVLWHERLNQIITGSANAETHVLYNPTMSQKGAATVMSKAPKRRHIDDDSSRTVDMAEGVAGDDVVNPNGTPITQGTSRHPTLGVTASGKSRDPRRPHIPVTTPFAKSQPDEEHIKNSIPLSSMRDEDPREALLKYADRAQKDPLFTGAWQKTQPKTIYANISDDEEEDGPDKKKVRRG
jgi:WD repeat-containing protein 70